MHAYEQQESSPEQDQSSNYKSHRNDKESHDKDMTMGQEQRAGLWRDNFAARKTMGYQAYHGMSQQQKVRVSSEVKKNWLAGKTPTRLLSALPTSSSRPQPTLTALKPGLRESS